MSPGCPQRSSTPMAQGDAGRKGKPSKGEQLLEGTYQRGKKSKNVLEVWLRRQQPARRPREFHSRVAVYFAGYLISFHYDRQGQYSQNENIILFLIKLLSKGSWLWFQL